MTQELLADLRSRINPAYQDMRGTESYERKQCADAIEALMGRLEKAEKDARRYQVLRNPPYSDNWGDVYAMTFQRTGDMPLKEEELDAAVDRLIYAAMEASK